MPAFAHRAITRFRCLQESCEDTCCAGLTIPVEAETVEALTREGLGDGVVEASGLRVLAKRAHGGCHFLEGGRCGVQLRFGERALPSACSMFPRKVRERGVRDEVIGSLACPEMVRLTLCADDGLEWEPFDLGQLPRRVDGTFRPPESAPELAAILECNYALASRLAMQAQLAFVLETGADGSAGLSELQREAIDHNFMSLSLPADAMNESLDALLAQVLEEKRSNPGAARFVAWAGQVLGAQEALLSRVETDRLAVLLTRRARYGLEQGGSPLKSVGQQALRLALIARAVLRTAGESIDARFVRATQLLAKHVESSPALAALEEALFDVEPQRAMFSCWLLAKTLGC